MVIDNTSRSLDSGQRVFRCGHSFHAFVSDILIELAKRARLGVMERSDFTFQIS